MTEEENQMRRRGVLKTVGTVAALGVTGTGTAMGRGGPGSDSGGPPGDDEPGGPPGDDESDDSGKRPIEWDGRRGSENATKYCPVGYEACWKWVLTPGGQPPLEDVGDLSVSFEDGTKVEGIEGEQGGQGRGNGAYQFEVCKRGGGTVDSAKVEDVVGGGPNAALTISEVECVRSNVAFWQIDFGEGEEPPDPPDYGDGPDLVMAAVGNSKDATWNPSFTQSRSYVDTVFGSDDTDDWEFEFDDEGENLETVTVEFTVPEDEDVEPLHLAVFERPPQEFDDEPDEEPPGTDDIALDEQVRFDNVSVEPSEQEGTEFELTAELPAQASIE